MSNTIQNTFDLMNNLRSWVIKECDVDPTIAIAINYPDQEHLALILSIILPTIGAGYNIGFTEEDLSVKVEDIHTLDGFPQLKEWIDDIKNNPPTPTSDGCGENCSCGN